MTSRLQSDREPSEKSKSWAVSLARVGLALSVFMILEFALFAGSLIKSEWGDALRPLVNTVLEPVALLAGLIVVIVILTIAGIGGGRARRIAMVAGFLLLSSGVLVGVPAFLVSVAW